MIGAFEQWLPQGIARGKAEGVAEGVHAVIMRVIAKRFAASPVQAVTPRIEAIGSAEALAEIVGLGAAGATSATLLAKFDRDRRAQA